MGKRLTSPRPLEAMPAPITAPDTSIEDTKAESSTVDTKTDASPVLETTSDNERPVREKLKKTSIAGFSKEGITSSGTTEATGDTTSLQDDLATATEPQSEEVPLASVEKGGNDVQSAVDTPRTPETKPVEDADISQQSPTSPALASEAGEYKRPERKRSRDQFDNDEEEDVSDNTSNPSRPASKLEKEQPGPDKKKKRDGTVEAEEDIPTEIKIDAAGSAFLNPPKRSGFAILGEKATTESVFRSPQKGDNAPAFSGFGSLSGTASPFSSRLAPEPMSISPFTSPSKPATSAFGTFGAGGSSIGTFGSTPTAFGSRPGSSAGAFSSALNGGGLSAFGSGSSEITGLSSKPAKPFGAPASEPSSEGEEDSSDENEADGDDSANVEKVKAKDDTKFHQQKPETGEDGERTEFTCRAKLFQYKDKQWKERGVGTLKLKVTDIDEDDDEAVITTSKTNEKSSDVGTENKRAARILMRADGVYRVILNTPIFKGFIIGDENGNEPKGKVVRLSSVEGGQAVPLLLRIGKEDIAFELYERVMAIAETL